MGASTARQIAQQGPSKDLSEFRFSPTPSGKVLQMSDLVNRIEEAFQDVSPGGPIQIDGNCYSLGRSPACYRAYSCDLREWITIKDDFTYMLKNADETIHISIQFDGHGYVGTARYLQYRSPNGTLRSGDQFLIRRLREVFDHYVDGPTQKLPL